MKSIYTWLMVCIMGCLMTACSATGNIASAANDIHNRAQMTKDLMSSLRDVAADNPQAIGISNTVDSLQDKIIQHVSSIHTNLTHTQDTVNIWAKILLYGLILGICIAIIYFCGPLIRRFTGLVASFIPSSKTSGVTHLLKTAVDEPNQNNIESATAAIRTAYPEVNVAYTRLRNQEKLNVPTTPTG